MKKVIVLLMVAIMVLLAGSSLAGQTYPLGFGNVAVKVDYLRFTDSQVSDLGLANAPYIGAEFYFPVWDPNFYLGLESGVAWSSANKNFQFFDVAGVPFDVKVDLDLTYVPIEFNAKYVFALTPSLALDLGGGISYSYLNIGSSGQINGNNRGFDGDSDWLFGGQFFLDLNYKMGPWFTGANVKYQITQDISVDDVDTDVSASNFRVGGQLGYMF